MLNIEIKMFAAAAVLIIAGSLIGCCDNDQNDIKDKYEKDGADFLGAVGFYHVALQSIECVETDDGFFGGNQDELTISMSCGGDVKKMRKSMKAGDSHKSDCTGNGIGDIWTKMQLDCEPGSNVNVALSEEDDFSPTDGGANTVTWDTISYLTHRTVLKVGVTVGSQHWWDKLGDAFIGTVGVCLTDFIPSTWAMKAMKLSARTVKFFRKANKAVKIYSHAQRRAGQCQEMTDDSLGCATVGDALDTVWDAQCLSQTPGQYKLNLEFTAHAYGMRASVFVCLIAGLALWM